MRSPCLFGVERLRCTQTCTPHPFLKRLFATTLPIQEETIEDVLQNSSFNRTLPHSRVDVEGCSVSHNEMSVPACHPAHCASQPQHSSVLLNFELPIIFASRFWGRKVVTFGLKDEASLTNILYTAIFGYYAFGSRGRAVRLKRYSAI